MSKFASYNLSQSIQPSLVLVVDDDRGMRILLRHVVEQEGYRVIEAEDGKQALEVCQNFQPDVVLLDSLMPVMDGMTCCQKLFALYGDRTAVVMITRLDDAASIDRAFAAGAIDYVIKPIHAPVLRQKVLKVMQQITLMKQLYQSNRELEQYTQFYNVALKERTAQFQRASELEQVLKRITDQVCESWDEAQILQLAVNELGVALNTIRCNIGLYDPEQTSSSIRSEYTVSLKSYQGDVISIDTLPEVYQHLIQGVSVQFCSIQPSLLDGKTAMFVFPIQCEKQSMGDLWLVCSAHQVLDDLETRLVKQVANQCAIVIRQAHIQQALQAQVQELKRLNQVKDDFLNTVSHELRSPMTNIRMAAQMLGQLTTRSTEKHGDAVLQDSNFAKGLVYLQVVQSECDREISLINDLLDLQRLEAGEQPISLSFICLEKWLLRLIQPFQERAQQRQQSLELNLDGNLPSIESNPDSLSRIFTELLHNACKYTPPGGLITVSISFDSDSKLFQIRIKNTGIEIPESEYDRIFEKFYRIPKGDRWKQGGTGLGLALVKGMVENLGGSIQVESASLQTCFIIQLPSTKGL